MKKLFTILTVLAALGPLGGHLVAGEAAREHAIQRIWLSPAAQKSGGLVVCWETNEPGDSVVEFGATAELGHRVARDEATTLHQVEIPGAPSDAGWHYRVRSGDGDSAICHVPGLPADVFRVAVVGNAGYARAAWGDAVLRDRPHLLVTAGDNVPRLHQGKRVSPDTTVAFSRFIDRYPELFRSTPLLPCLGNHDKEVRPRGPKPPPESVYDIRATAYRKFFALPGDEWKWHFDVPRFGLRLIALDLNHLRDVGTTWQSCHRYDVHSEQFQWYRRLMAESKQPFVITLYNAQNSAVRHLEGGQWGRIIRQGSLAIAGFGHYGERAEVDGFTYYNTSVVGTGDRYPDSKSVLLKSENNYLLLTFRRGDRLTVELKNLGGKALDRKTFPVLAKR